MSKRLWLVMLLIALGLQNQAQKSHWLIGENGLMALCDSTGKPVTDYLYEMINDFHDGLAAVREEGLWGFVNAQGTLVIKPKFLQTYYFSNGFCPVTKNGEKWYFINKKGRRAFRGKFQNALPFGNELAPVKKDNLWGYLNTEGEWSIPPYYEAADIFSEGLASVRIKNLWGYINKYGQTIIPAKYDQAYPFLDGKARVMLEGELYYIDKQGRVLEKIETHEDKIKIYRLADKMPVFPGGYEAMFDYIQKNMHYPEPEKESGLEGRVTLSILVDTTGRISNVKIVRGFTTNFEKEALRLVKEMPRWIPGEIQGKKVNVQFLLNIDFKLNKEENPEKED